ncbi:MAG: hypothetical protein RL434_1037 [Pseudomonadota bacterium]|jgi:hypothetical protein
MKLKSIADIRADHPPATAREARRVGRRDDDHPLQVYLPKAVHKALRFASVERDTTVRALVLEALVKAGYAIDPGEVGDRRDPARRRAR